MRRVRGRNTTPELKVRRLLHAAGYRYRLHDRRLPGSPDLVFRKRRKVIFVHGCFWHGHDCPRGSRAPKANQTFWQAKFDRNRARDVRDLETLTRLGWRSLVVWECELKDSGELEKRLKAFLGDTIADAAEA